MARAPLRLLLASRGTSNRVGELEREGGPGQETTEEP
jgi:hypothetical protein